MGNTHERDEIAKLAKKEFLGLAGGVGKLVGKGLAGRTDITKAHRAFTSGRDEVKAGFGLGAKEGTSIFLKAMLGSNGAHITNDTHLSPHANTRNVSNATDVPPNPTRKTAWPITTALIGLGWGTALVGFGREAVTPYYGNASPFARDPMTEGRHPAPKHFTDYEHLKAHPDFAHRFGGVEQKAGENQNYYTNPNTPPPPDLHYHHQDHLPGYLDSL